MGNSVAAAKQPSDKNFCTIDDVVMYEDVTNILSVDDEGYVNGQIDHTEGDFRCYHCDNCGQEFGNSTYDPIKAWRQVKEHLHDS